MINIIGNRIGAKKSGGAANLAFEFTVDTTQTGTSAADQFTIPITSATPYNISTSDGHSITGATGATTLTFSAPGTYTVSITESCEGWRFNNGGDGRKLMTIEKWGIFTFTTNNAFHGCSNLVANYSDTPTIATTNLSSTFAGCGKFNGYVNDWDISGVTNLGTMFFACTVFNQDLGNWDVSSVTNLGYMFNDARAFTGIGVENWNPGPITSLEFTFRRTDFQADIGHWDVSNVTSFANCFSSALNFNQDISGWTIKNTGTVNMSGMFSGGQFDGTHTFNQDISGWDTSAVTSMQSMFTYSVFNQNISSWNTANVTNMNQMFYQNNVFNQPIGSWDVSSVTNFGSTFGGATSFDQDLSAWTFSPSLSNLNYTFQNATSFNNGGQPLTWNISNFTAMDSTFYGASSFNADISSWAGNTISNWNQTFRLTALNQNINSIITSSATNLRYTFRDANSFNNAGVALNLNTSNVTNMQYMFGTAALVNQISGLDSFEVENVTFGDGFIQSPRALTTANYDALLVSWESKLQALYPGGVGYVNTPTFAFGLSTYTLGSAAETARTSLINTYGWTIIDGAGVVAPFAFTVDTTIAGSSGVGNFQLPLVSTSTVNAAVDWGDGIINNVTAYNDPNATHTYSTPGAYNIKINGTIDGWSFNGIPEALKMTNVSSVSPLTVNVSRAFSGCSNMTWTATDAPVSITGDLYKMFANCTIFNGAIGNWDMSNVTGNGFWLMFENASSFNQDISGWDVSGITKFQQMFRFATSFNNGGSALTWDMSSANNVYEMFYGATNFNADISSWVFPNVTSLSRLLLGCSSFNQDISSWNVSGVSNMSEMFTNATAFNQDISSWNVGNVTTMSAMFLNATSYNQPITAWNTSNVTTMARMFEGATSFSQNIESLNTTSLTDISSLFKSTLYNQPLGLLNTSNITTIANIFEFNSAFNQDISTWNMSSLQSMRQAFKGATSFNQSIGNWNITSSLTDMYDVFSGASSFDNQNLNSWDTSNVTTMFNLFVFTTPNLNVDFNQWDVSSVSTFGFAFKQTGTIVNYDAVLVGWEASLQAAYPGGVGYPHTPSITFGSSTYTLGSAAEAARTSLISTYGWTITDGGGI